MTSRRVLVTGAAGMVGSNLVPVLLASGWEVSGIDDLSMGFLANLEPCFEDSAFSMTVGDVRDAATYRSAAEGADAVIHLAAKKIPKLGHAMDTLVVNSECAEMVLGEAARTGARVLLASTSDVYGMSPEQPVSEESPCVLGPSTVKRWSYAVSKLFDEHLAHAFSAEHGVDVTIMRFFNSYGPHHHRSWWGGPQSVFIDAALEGRSMSVHGDGTQQRCFTYASDLMDGIALCLESDRLSGHVINLGNPDGEVTITELARLVCELTDRDFEQAVVFEPHEELFGRYQEVVRRVPDISKARELLGYAPSIPLREGLERTIEWHLENPKMVEAV
jgi:UDP-glucose 4-epimerase